MEDIKKAIEQSGFLLENYVSMILKEHGWQIITNRNYIDDVKGVEREIDILAYKVFADEQENIDYITTLIISCKKSDKYKWCFLTRDIDANACNINWTPLHYCTSDDRLKYMTENHSEIITNRYKIHRAVRHLYNFDKMVFAYAQLAEPQNKNERKQKGNLYAASNEDIYNSISTTIKAISNEKVSRMRAYGDARKKRYYTFHALSVFEGEMYDVHFDKEGVDEVTKIQSIQYINRHIVNNIDDFYIVNFINREEFGYRLQIFDFLHQENMRTLPKLLKGFYKNIFEYPERVKLIWDKFVLKMTIQVSMALPHPYRPVSLSYDYGKVAKHLHIEVSSTQADISEADIEALNNNEKLRKKTQEYLKKLFDFDGQFSFTEVLPF